MELKVMKCKSCGAVLDVRPWSSRVVCSSCGMVYFVENSNAAGSASRQATAQGGNAQSSPDNPVDVILVPSGDKTISLGMVFSPEDWRSQEPNLSNMASFTIQYIADDCVRYEYNHHGCSPEYRKDLLADFESELDRRITFFSLLSMLSGEGFDLDIGNMYLDFRALYDRTVYKESPAKESVNTENYIEPDIYYFNNKIDSLKRTKDSFSIASCSKAERDKFYRELDKCADEIVSKYQLGYKDEIRYSAPAIEQYRVLSVLGISHPDKYRAWGLRFRDRRLFKTVQPGDAAALLSPEQIDTAERVGRNECVEIIAERLFRELAAEEQAELQAREDPAYKYYVSINVSAGNVNYHRDILKYGKLYKAYSQKYEFKEFGMKDIEDPFIRSCLTAHIFTKLREYEKKGGYVGWNITGYKGSSVVDLKLAATTRGIYKDWV
ncbi:MAG: hypothetical protein IJM08_05835 [Firmicutes bacterium]|nr:hypothetical protein [Bacillota bacterium]